MMAAGEEGEETLISIDHQSSSITACSSSLSSSSSSAAAAAASDPSLSRNLSFSKLNARAPEFVPNRPPSPHQQQQMTVIPPTPLPPPAPPMMMPPPSPPPPHHHHQIYPPPPPPPPSPFHLPVHRPLPLHPHLHPYPHQQQQQQQQHHVAVLNPNNQQHHHHHHLPHSHHPSDDMDPPPPPPKHETGLSNEAMHKLLNQVEYYFSDLNLATTDHLMRFISKDPDSYVPISVVASFKKVKAAIHNNSHLASILRNSSKLEVSEDGKKVRRQHPFTESDLEELQSRIVIAENLPDDHCHQNLMKIFSAVGSVKSIRTCPPQTSGTGPSSASRFAKTDGMHFINKLHAFVEYESVEVAEKAVAELNDEGNWRSGLRVRLMIKHTSKPNQVRGKKSHEGHGPAEEDEVYLSEQQLNQKQMEDPASQHDVHSHENLGEDQSNEKGGGQRKGKNRARGKGRGRGQHQQHQDNRGNHVGAPVSNNVAIGEQQSMAKQQHPGPRMPDGTRGFTMGRGKPVVVNIP